MTTRLVPSVPKERASPGEGLASPADPVGLAVTTPAQAAAFTFGHPAPDPELFAVVQRVLEAILPDHAAPADFFGLSGRATSFWEEQVGVNTQAVRRTLPRRHFAVPAEPARISRYAQQTRQISHRRLPSLVVGQIARPSRAPRCGTSVPSCGVNLMRTL